MANEVRIRATADTRDADAKLGGMAKAWKQFQESGSKGGFAIGASAAVAAKGLDLIGGAALGAGRAVGDFIGDSIKAASALEQSVGGVEAVFGPAADKVAKFGESAAKSIGLSKNAVNEMATIIGAKLQGMGFDAQKAADQTLLLQQRGADLAATFGGTTSDAITAMSSLLSGERDPIEKYGVSIKEADVQARILAKGLDTSTTETKKNAVAVASLELLMESTAKATGRFAAEMDSLAGKQQIANAELENSQARLGKSFIPIAKGITDKQIEIVEWAVNVADSFEGRVTPAMLESAAAGGKLEAVTEGVRSKISELDKETLEAAIKLGIFTEAEGKAALAARGVSDATAYMASHVKDDTERASDATKTEAKKMVTAYGSIGGAAIKAEHQVDVAMKGVVDSIKSARGDLESAADDAADAIYGPIIAEGERAVIERDIAEQKQIIASKSSTREQVQDAKIRLAELRKAQIANLATLASYGKKSAKDALTNSIKTLEATKDLTDEQKVELKELRAALKLLEGSYNAARAAGQRLADVRIDNQISRNGQAPIPRAKGGPVKANTAYLVNENTPRSEIFVPDQSGYILPEAPKAPTGGMSGGSGGGWNGGAIPVPVPMNWSPAQQQAWAREAAPVLARELQRQGII